MLKRLMEEDKDPQSPHVSNVGKQDTCRELALKGQGKTREDPLLGYAPGARKAGTGRVNVDLSSTRMELLFHGREKKKEKRCQKTRFGAASQPRKKRGK